MNPIIKSFATMVALAAMFALFVYALAETLVRGKAVLIDLDPDL